VCDGVRREDGPGGYPRVLGILLPQRTEAAFSVDGTHRLTAEIVRLLARRRTATHEHRHQPRLRQLTVLIIAVPINTTSGLPPLPGGEI
jgi:hypothetical protein